MLLQTARLMGARYRPPAAVVLQYLYAGTPLRLAPEPENPHDPAAMQVILARANFPSLEADPQLEDHLAASGWSAEAFYALEELHLGYIERLLAPMWAEQRAGVLRFDGNGFPLVAPAVEYR